MADMDSFNYWIIFSAKGLKENYKLLSDNLESLRGEVSGNITMRYNFPQIHEPFFSTFNRHKELLFRKCCFEIKSFIIRGKIRNPTGWNKK